MSERDFSEKMPATIGRYQVQESVGFGAMGAVYKAFDPLIKRTLAIKTIRLDIPKQSSQYQSFIERFYHEARISGTLSHPNIVTLFDIGEEHGIPYLAMEYVPGETVSQLLEKGTRFAPERVVSIVSQVASAVDYAHGRGVVHRDIKPSNIILHDGDKVKVTDFGIAKLANADMTQSGTLLGTPSYMSPEQAMGEKVDGRSDIFSLGVCAYEMLSSQQPFPGSNVTSILYKLVHDEPQVPPDLETNGLVPDKWREVFSKVLAKKPVDRYETAGAFVADLEYCLASWFGSLSEATLIAPSKARATILTAATATVPPPVPPDASVTVVKRPDKISTSPIVVNPTLQIPGESETPPPSNEDVTVATPPPPAITVSVPEPAAAAGSNDATSAELVTIVTPAQPPAAAAPPTPGAPPTPVVSTRPEDKTVIGQRSTAAAAPKPAPKPKPGPGAGAGAPKRSVLPLLLLGVGAIAVLAVLGIWFARRSAIPEPTPTPVVEATPTPLPSIAAPVAGTIHVESEPNGAAVLLNGEARGNTPLDLADVPFGEHTVRIDMRGYESQTQKVTLSAEALAAQLKATLSRRSPTMASLDISSQPLGADVSVDGGIVGRTPILDMKLRPGNYRVEVRREGFENFSTTVRAEAGKKANVDAVLKAVAGPAATPRPAESQAAPGDPNAIYAPEEVDTRPVRVAGLTASYPSGKLPRLRQGQATSVTVSYVVSETGEVSDTKVTESGGPVLDEEVMKAVRGFRYTPGQKGGRPVKVRMSFKQTFRGA